MTASDRHDKECICERFDDEWSLENAGPRGLRGFLQQVGLAFHRDQSLLSELIQIDIERTWMSWAKRLRATDGPIPAAELEERFQRLNRLTDYADLTSAGWSDAKFWAEIAQCEVDSRDQWGDAIGPLHYAHHFQLSVSQTKRRHSHRMRCLLEGAKMTDAVEGLPLRGSTKIGRRRRTEDGDETLIESPDGNRIVVATKLETQISREHLAVQLLSPDYAIVKNISHVNPVRIKSDKSMLNPREASALSFPFTLQLAGRQLQFFRSDAS